MTTPAAPVPSGEWALAGGAGAKALANEGPERPFVHALLPGVQISVCVDLPGGPDPTATGGWTIALPDDGRALTATGERPGKAFVMDVTDRFPVLLGAA